PFAALCVQPAEAVAANQAGAGGYRPLIADNEVSYLPSFSVLAVLRQMAARIPRARHGLAVFADPVFQGPAADRSTLIRSARAARAAALASSLRKAGIRPGVLTRLPSSRVEADSIVAAAKGEPVLKAMGLEASVPSLKQIDLGQYRIIHFATHGSVNSKRPE